MHNRASRQHAFTLIETLASVALLSVVCVLGIGLLSGLGGGRSTAIAAHTISEAAGHARLAAQAHGGAQLRCLNNQLTVVYQPGNAASAAPDVARRVDYPLPRGWTLACRDVDNRSNIETLYFDRLGTSADARFVVEHRGGTQLALELLGLSGQLNTHEHGDEPRDAISRERAR